MTTTYRLDIPAGATHPCRGTWRDPDGRAADLDELIGLDARAVLVTIAPDGVTLDTDPDIVPGMWAPDLTADSDDEGNHTAATDADLIRQAKSHGWDLVTGYTGQHGYSGPMFHESEYVGGGLADLIAGHDDDTPRRTLWTSASVSELDGEPPSSWVLAYRELS